MLFVLCFCAVSSCALREASSSLFFFYERRRVTVHRFGSTNLNSTLRILSKCEVRGFPAYFLATRERGHEMLVLLQDSVKMLRIVG